MGICSAHNSQQIRGVQLPANGVKVDPETPPFGVPFYPEILLRGEDLSHFGVLRGNFGVKREGVKDVQYQVFIETSGYFGVNANPETPRAFRLRGKKPPPYTGRFTPKRRGGG